MDSKRLTIKRLAIFYILAILPLIGFSAGLTAVFGEPAFASKNPEALKWAGFLGTAAMFAPAIAHILTRLITKEGWRNTYLGFTAKKGNIGYFAFSVFYKPVESLIFIIILWLLFLNGMSFAEAFDFSRPVSQASVFLFQLAGSLVFFFPAFGEEWGWRGYMMPKLLELMPKPAAIITGGVLWGLWHAPLTVIGHNFGVDYTGFPFAGIAVMCAVCIITNAVLTFLTERTRSIYPASFCHMINNNLSPFIFMSLFFSGEAAAAINEKLSPILIFTAYAVLALVTGAICFVLFIRKKKD